MTNEKIILLLTLIENEKFGMIPSGQSEEIDSIFKEMRQSAIDGNGVVYLPMSFHMIEKFYIKFNDKIFSIGQVHSTTPYYYFELVDSTPHPVTEYA